MFQTILSRTGWFIALCLLQVLVFNHVHIFGYATPLPYLYFLIILPLDTPRWLYVLSGFVLGLIIDLFTNTPGMAAAATCLSGLTIPLFLKLFCPADCDESLEPSHKSMEWGAFTKYVFCATLLHCATFFTLEAFSFFNWEQLLLNIAGSTVLTLLFIIAMELIRTK